MRLGAFGADAVASLAPLPVGPRLANLPIEHACVYRKRVAILPLFWFWLMQLNVTCHLLTAFLCRETSVICNSLIATLLPCSGHSQSLFVTNLAHVLNFVLMLQ